MIPLDHYYQFWGLTYCYFIHKGNPLVFNTKGQFSLIPIVLSPMHMNLNHYVFFAKYFLQQIVGNFKYIEIDKYPVLQLIEFYTLDTTFISLKNDRLCLLGKKFITYLNTLFAQKNNFKLNLLLN